MKRNAWYAVWGILLSAGIAAAQPMPNLGGGYGPPGMYGYPGSPPASVPVPYGQAFPYPVAPTQYGAPMPSNIGVVPHMPYANVYQPTPPGQDSNGPANAGEPYLVPREKSTPIRIVPEGKPIPGAELQTPSAGSSFDRIVDFISPEPSEPYTTYEGPRYPAEMRQDNTRMWVNAGYIHWWIRRDNTPPLVTTGNLAQAVPGAFTDPGTTVLLGDGAIGPKEFSGMQANLGFWLDPEKLESLELGGFWLGKAGRQYSFASDAGGSPLLATPVLTPNESVFAFAAPGASVGRVSVGSGMNFFGLEANLGRNLVRVNNWTIDGLVGFRYLYLNDTLTANYDVTSLVAGLPFAGSSLPAGSSVSIADSFNITNRFYGGQLGARFNWVCCRFDVTGVAKFALGANSQVAVIDGTTTLGGTTNTASGGVLAQPSNIGRHTDTAFAIVPQGDITVGYHVTCCLRVFTGYTFLYWNRIQRAADQIDRQIDLTQPPTSAAFGPGSGAFHPHYYANRTDFWAQGFNLGVELKY